MVEIRLGQSDQRLNGERDYGLSDQNDDVDDNHADEDDGENYRIKVQQPR